MILVPPLVESSFGEMIVRLIKGVSWRHAVRIDKTGAHFLDETRGSHGRHQYEGWVPTTKQCLSLETTQKHDGKTRIRSSKTIRFLKQEEVPVLQVNETCERCPLTDCSERAAPASVVENRTHQETIRQQLGVLLGQESAKVQS